MSVTILRFTHRAQARPLPAALIGLSLVVGANPAAAQEEDVSRRGFTMAIGFGAATSVRAPEFREAFTSQFGGDVAFGYQLTPMWSLRASGGLMSFQYDWSRLVPGRQRYLPADGGAAPTVDVGNITVGAIVHPWRLGRVRPYASAGFAVIIRDAGSARLDVRAACQFPGFSDPSWQPPAYCAQALSETDVGGSGLGIDVGVGVRVHVVGRLAAYGEIRYVDDFAGRGVGVIPFRVGVVLFLKPAA